MAFSSTQVLGAIAAVIFVIFLVFALYRLRHVPIESKEKEFVHVIISSAEATAAITIIITTILDVFFPQFLQDSSAGLFASGFLGGILLLWWAYASYRRQMNAIQRIKGSDSPNRDDGTKAVVVPSPPPRIYSQTPAVERLLPNLSRFTVRWEQYKKLGQVRWMSPNLDDMQKEVKILSNRILDVIADTRKSTDLAILNKLELLSNYLNQFGNFHVYTIGSSDVQSMDSIGDVAYRIAKQLISDKEDD